MSSLNQKCFVLYRKILQQSQKRETCFWAVLKSLTLGSAVRTSSKRGLGTGRQWIGECTVSLISLIFQWKHSNYFGVDVLFRSPIKHKDTSILLQSIELLGDLSHDFDLLWFLSPLLWWGCGADAGFSHARLPGSAQVNGDGNKCFTQVLSSAVRISIKLSLTHLKSCLLTFSETLGPEDLYKWSLALVHLCLSSVCKLFQSCPLSVPKVTWSAAWDGDCFWRLLGKTPVKNGTIFTTLEVWAKFSRGRIRCASIGRRENWRSNGEERSFLCFLFWERLIYAAVPWLWGVKEQLAWGDCCASSFRANWGITALQPRGFCWWKHLWI